jgi:lysophospholipase L1-like esterase
MCELAQTAYSGSGTRPTAEEETAVKSIQLLAVLGGALLALTAPVAASAKQPPKPYYLSLGDSLAAGVQPGPDGVARNTRQGFAHQLARRAGGVRLANYGCGFATTSSMIGGDRGCLPARDPGYRNVSPQTSQLAAAERFLKRNRGRVAFATIDIGANDVASCGAGGQIDLPCVSKGVNEIARNAPTIARRLRRAAGKGTPMAVMTLYDPFLALWFGGPGGKVLAKASQDLARNQVNAVIVEAFAARGFEVADVAKAFKSYTPFPTEGESTGPPPVAVAEICRLTWMCTPAPRGPDIHANKAGYGAIAGSFRRALGKAAR